MNYRSIDIMEALNQLGGSEKLYKTIVMGFYQRYRQVDAVINECLVLGDVDEARRIAHSIKGLCGNLGAAGLREKAADLERAIDTEGMEEGVSLHAFSEELVLVVEDIERILEERYEVDQQAEAMNKAIDTFFKEACHELSTTLGSYVYSDIKAALGHLRTFEVPETHMESMGEIIHLIDCFEYDQANDLLREVLE